MKATQTRYIQISSYILKYKYFPAYLFKKLENDNLLIIAEIHAKVENIMQFPSNSYYNNWKDVEP